MNYEDEEEEQFNYSDEIKKKRKFTKDDAIYGVFKEDWEDDGYGDDDESSKMTEDDYYKMKKRYSTPIGFVASGIYEPNENKLKNDEKDDKEDDEEKKKRKKEKKEKKEKKQNKQKKNKRGGLGSGLGYNNNNTSDDDSSYSNNVEDKKVGGIGAALLSKMGYKGSGGLGRDGSGMVEPIKVTVRPKNAGLSSVSEAKNNSDSSSSSDDESSSDDDDGDGNKRSLGWKKKEKLKYNFDEHLEQSTSKKSTTTTPTSTGIASSSSPQIVIDMRGPETKLYTGIEEVKNRQFHATQATGHSHHTTQGKPLGELKHNIELLFKLKQIDLQNQENKIKYEKDKINNLTRGIDKLKLTIENDELQIKKVNHILELITTSKKQLENGELDLKQLYKTMKLLKSQYSKEFQSFKLYNLEKELLEPLLIEKLNKWDIESNPSYLSNELIKWRSLFGEGTGTDGGNSNVYFLIIRDLILPKFKQYLRTEWDVKKPVIAATLISKWSESLPETVQEIILEQSILPKLKVAIEKWDPKKDVVPLDYWLLPWLPFLKAELETFFPTIRQKIISVLSEWHPSDQSAIKFLTPWRNVFESNSMESLLNRSILPKLSKSIKDLIINPTNQQSPIEIQWLLQWSSTSTSTSTSTPFIPIEIIINILEKDFFTRWLKILLDWLKLPDTDLEQVSNWYSGWKKQFPPEIISNDKIKSIFNIALNLMKKSLSDQPIEKFDEDIINNKINSILNSNNNSSNYFSQLQKQQPIKSITTPTTTTPTPTPTNNNNNFDNLSTKEMIEQLAINNGLLFLPLQHKKTDTGQQIYLFDKIQIIIDRDLIMCNNNNRWEPANIQYLLDKSIK